MRHIIKNISVLSFLSLVLVLASCQDDQWDKHYDKDGNLPEETIYDLIAQDSELSTFLKMVDIAGYKDLLSSTQTFTVWAPVNESLEAVDLNDVNEVKTLVRNHISRFNISTATPLHKNIRMINKKVYQFTNDGELNFGGATLTSRDHLAKNGILHKVSKEIPLFFNFYEYMASDENTSKVWEFISSFTEVKFSEELSSAIGVDENGQTIYDSVFITKNILLEGINTSNRRIGGLGSINTEDSVYTMIIPSNKAWDAAYARISPYFKTYNSNQAYADSVQKIQTSLAIVENLVYRSQLTLPSDLDSIVSTTGSAIYDVNDLFAGSFWKQASNGAIYLTDEIRYKNDETWQKNIKVEAENTLYRKLGRSTMVEVRPVTDFSLGISDNEFLEVRPTSTTAQPSMTFYLPDILAGKYDIYAVFVPQILIDQEGRMNDSTRLEFELSYVGLDGKMKSKTNSAKDLLTSPSKLVKMKIFEGFEFPTSNYYDRLWYMDEKNGIDKVTFNTELLIMTSVTNKEFNDNVLTRRFNIDRIILEPVRSN